MEIKSEGLEASFEAVERRGVPGVRPMLAGAQPSATMFEGFLRSGSGGVEMKAFTGATDAAGGYAVPESIDAQIDALLKSVSPIRSIANVVRIGANGYRKLVTSGGTPSGWAAETGARAETDTPVFNEIAPPMGELFANPAASQTMLDDSAFDVETWLGNEIAMEFARAEGAAFVSGNGTNKPKGFLSGTMASTADGVRAFGSLQYVPTGSAGAFAANPEEKLIDLVQTLRSPYRQGAVWRELLSGAGVRSVSVSGAGVFMGSAAEARVKANALSGVLDDYRLAFESGATMTGRFLVTRLDYAGDYNGERSYTVSLESSGAVVSA